MQRSTRKLPPELILDILQDLSVPDLLLARQVNSQYRTLTLHIDNPLRLRLLRLALEMIRHPLQLYNAYESDPSRLVPLIDRIAYVVYIESKHNIRIPEPYRTVLKEWPVSRPPNGHHWPHAVRFFSNGFCSCRRHFFENNYCRCEDREVYTESVTMSIELFDRIFEGKTFNRGYRTSDRDVYAKHWEISSFSHPSRLNWHAPEQDDETRRFLLAYPRTAYETTNFSLLQLKVKVLRLSRYCVGEGQDGYTSGNFVMVLEGPCAGQIHAWGNGWWYDGFEASSFLDWKHDG
jgi:hypothetical protein